jgi:hypothetical protein
MFRLTRVIVKVRSETFGFSSIITYSFLFWRLLVGESIYRQQQRARLRSQLCPYVSDIHATEQGLQSGSDWVTP